MIPAAPEPNVVPKVLAFAPGVRLLTKSEKEWIDDVVRLMRLARRMGRLLLMPEPFCNTSWVS